MAEYKQYITQIQEGGNVMISEDVVATIVEHTLTEVEGVVRGGSEVVGKKHWGKGIAAEAARAVIDRVEAPGVTLGSGPQTAETLVRAVVHIRQRGEG